MEEIRNEIEEVVVESEPSTELAVQETEGNNALAIAAVVGGVLVLGTLAYKGGKKVKGWLKKRKEAKSAGEVFGDDFDEEMEEDEVVETQE